MNEQLKQVKLEQISQFGYEIRDLEAKIEWKLKEIRTIKEELETDDKRERIKLGLCPTCYGLILYFNSTNDTFYCRNCSYTINREDRDKIRDEIVF